MLQRVPRKPWLDGRYLPGCQLLHLLEEDPHVPSGRISRRGFQLRVGTERVKGGGLRGLPVRGLDEPGDVEPDRPVFTDGSAEEIFAPDEASEPRHDGHRRLGPSTPNDRDQQPGPLGKP